MSSAPGVPAPCREPTKPEHGVPVQWSRGGRSAPVPSSAFFPCLREAVWRGRCGSGVGLLSVLGQGAGHYCCGGRVSPAVSPWDLKKPLLFHCSSLSLQEALSGSTSPPNIPGPNLQILSGLPSHSASQEPVTHVQELFCLHFTDETNQG